jgi:hypothetical protein
MNEQDAEQLIHVGARTLTGELFRRYWIPACRETRGFFIFPGRLCQSRTSCKK